MSRNYKFHNTVEEGLVYQSKGNVYNNERDYSDEKGLLDDIVIVD